MPHSHQPPTTAQSLENIANAILLQPLADADLLERVSPVKILEQHGPQLRELWVHERRANVLDPAGLERDGLLRRVDDGCRVWHWEEVGWPAGTIRVDGCGRDGGRRWVKRVGGVGWAGKVGGVTGAVDQRGLFDRERWGPVKVLTALGTRDWRERGNGGNRGSATARTTCV